MKRRLTKAMAQQWLREADGWEAGHNELFRYKDWSLGLRKEDESYLPYRFAVTGHKSATSETISRRYTSVEAAVLHVMNGFNENADCRDEYASLDEALNDPAGWIARVNTVVEYLYRDADNYKKRHNVVIIGEMTKEQETAIEQCLDDGGYFVPSMVGLPDERFGAETMADHPWFEWVGAEATAGKPTLRITAEELVARFQKASNGWQESADASADGLRPFSVTVRETMSRTVVIWAEDRYEAEEKAANLCNDSVIYLGDMDFVDRECECNGFARAYDMSTFEQYGSAKEKTWGETLDDAADAYAKAIRKGLRTIERVPPGLTERVRAILNKEKEKENGGEPG